MTVSCTLNITSTYITRRLATGTKMKYVFPCNNGTCLPSRHGADQEERDGGWSERKVGEQCDGVQRDPLPVKGGHEGRPYKNVGIMTAMKIYCRPTNATPRHCPKPGWWDQEKTRWREHRVRFQLLSPAEDVVGIRWRLQAHSDEMQQDSYFCACPTKRTT